MAEEIKFVVVGHHSRYKQALCLAESLGAVLLIDSGDQAKVVTQSRLFEILNRAPVGMCVSRINDDTFVVREMAVIQR